MTGIMIFTALFLIILVIVYIGKHPAVEQQKRPELDINQKVAMEMCLELGIELSYKSYHIYKSKQNEFCILNMNLQSEQMIEEEKIYTDLHEAVDSFIELSKL